MVDAVRQMLGEIQSTAHDGENDYVELRENLKRLQGTEGRSAESTHSVAGDVAELAVVPKPIQVSSVADPPSAPGEVKAPATPIKKTRATGPPAPDGKQRRPSAGKIGGLLVERGSITPEALALALQEQERGDQRRLGEILVALGLCKVEDILG